VNYLVHLYLSDGSDEGLLGNLMGDFVKGPLDGRYPLGIAAGILQHRRVDSFAHDHPVCRRSKQRMDPQFGYFRSIMVDVFYDHFTASNWERLHPAPLPAFAQRVYALLEEHRPILPAGLQQVAERMIRHNWLVSYREVEVVGRVLARLSQRLSRANPLARGLPELTANYRELESDCLQFLASARSFTQADERPRPSG
jgi:acyl carrier protein phosphodiesterase